MRVDGYVRVPDAEYVEMARHLRHYHVEMPGLMAMALEAQRRVDEGHWRAVDAEGHVGEPDPMPSWRLAVYTIGSLAAGVLFGLIAGSMGGVTVVTP